MTTLEYVEKLTDQVYGRGSAVSLNREMGRWHIRCWGKDGLLKGETDAPRKVEALRAMRAKLQRACFLRLEPGESGGSEG